MVEQRHILVIGMSAILILSGIGIGPALAAPMLNLSGTGGSTTAGSTVDVTLTLENTGNESSNGPAVQLADLPAGWSINSVSGDGGTPSSDNTQVLFLSVNSGSSVSPSWTLDVPANASAGEYTLTGKVLVSGSPQDTVNVTVTVQQSLELSGSGDKTTVEKATKPNEPPTLSFTVTNNANTNMSDTSIRITDHPEGWNVTNTGGDGTYSQSTKAFSYMDLGAGMSKTSTFKFDTPDDVSNGTYTVTVELVQNGSIESSMTVDVTLTGTLSEAYDQDGDDKVDSIAEAQSAVKDFSKGDLSIAEVQKLINEWASG